MSKKNLEDVLKEKLESKQFTYDESYWESAQTYIASQKKRGKGFFYYFTFALVFITVSSATAFGIWHLNKNSSESFSTINHSQPKHKSQTVNQQENKNTKDTQNIVNPEVDNTNYDSPNDSLNEKSTMLRSDKKYIKSYLSQQTTQHHQGINFANKDKLSPENRSNTEKSVSEILISQRHQQSGMFVESKKFKLLELNNTIENEEKNEFTLPQLNLFAVGMYGSFLKTNDLEAGRYTLSNQFQYSYGVFGEYALNSKIRFQAGAGYSTEQFNLKIDPDFSVDQIDEWDVSTSTDVFYNMSFQNGVPIEFDSTVITTVDSSLITTFDTLYADSIFNTTQANYRIHRIEIPLWIRFHETFGIYELFASTGAQFGILTDVNIPQLEVGMPEANKLNNLTINGALRLGTSIHISNKLRWSIAAHAQYEIIQPLKFIERRRALYGLHSSLIYRW